MKTNNFRLELGLWRLWARGPGRRIAQAAATDLSGRFLRELGMPWGGGGGGSLGLLGQGLWALELHLHAVRIQDSPRECRLSAVFPAALIESCRHLAGGLEACQLPFPQCITCH